MSHLNLPERIHEPHEVTIEWDWNQIELSPEFPITLYWPDYSPRQAEIEMLANELNPKFKYNPRSLAFTISNEIDEIKRKYAERKQAEMNKIIFGTL